MVLLFFLSGCLCWLGIDSIYVDYSNPYEYGPLTIENLTFSPSLMPINTPPMRTKVYYPLEEDICGTYYWLAGLGGLLPGGAFYDVMNTYIASHGYIVFAPWPLRGDNETAFSAEEHMANIDWLAENVDGHMDGPIASFDHLSMSCHSAGCGINLKIILNRTGLAKSLINLEPVNWQIKENQPDFYLPSFTMGAELANMTCSIPGFDFETWFSGLECPCVMLEVADVGHCDFLDDFPHNSCKATGFCPIGDPDIRLEYREMVAGFVSAFMTAYVQGYMDQLDYLTDMEKIPLPLLQHVVDVEC